MYIPYSGTSPLLRTYIGEITVVDIMDILGSAGWHDIAANVMQATSPQGFTTKVTLSTGVWYGRELIYCTFGNAAQGRTWAVRKEPISGTYQIHANKCQFFLSCVGIEFNSYGTVICGGVPFMPPTYLYPEVWWSCGDWIGDPTFEGSTFRRELLGKSYKSGIFDRQSRDAFYEETYCASGNIIGSPTIACFTSAGEINYAAVPTLANATFIDDTEFHIPALISWGLTSSDISKVRGVLWDALVSTGPNQMDTIRQFSRVTGDDEIMTFDGSTWINFTNEFYFGSLWLLMPFPGSNYTY